MSTNLVSYVMQFLTPDMIGRIAAALGLDRNNTQTAIGAAVPALLAGLSGAAAKPGGAQNLVDAVKQQSGVLDAFANMLGGGGGQSSFVDKGSTLLKSLLGGQDQSALVGALTKFSGLGQNAGNSLLGMLSPVVMGVIGKQIGGRNLDVGSLTSLLGAQKEQIAQAMPAGFDKLLAGTGLLDSLGGAASSAAAVAGQASRAAAAATGQVGQLASSAARSVSSAGQRAAGVATSAMPTWMYWAVPLAVIGGLVWYLLGHRTDQIAQQVPPQTIPVVQTVTVGGVDIGKQLGDSLGSLRTSLVGITDVASATAALPKLQEATAQVEKVSGVLGQLSVDQRKVVAGLVSPAAAALNQLFDKVLAIPGVGEVLKPAIDTLKTKLAELSRQTGTIGSGR